MVVLAQRVAEAVLTSRRRPAKEADREYMDFGREMSDDEFLGGVRSALPDAYGVTLAHGSRMGVDGTHA